MLCGDSAFASMEYREEDIWSGKPSIGMGEGGWWKNLFVPSENTSYASWIRRTSPKQGTLNLPGEPVREAGRSVPLHSLMETTSNRGLVSTSWENIGNTTTIARIAIHPLRMGTSLLAGLTTGEEEACRQSKRL